MNVMDQVRDYIKKKVAVVLYESTELGDRRWAVAVDQEVDSVHGTFWLNSFVRKDRAIAYCKKHKLKFRISKNLNNF